MTDFFFAALPIAILIFCMTKPNPIPSVPAFAMAALLALGVRFFWFETSANLLGAAVLAGLLSALTPVAIVFGAILFFVAMEKSGAMAVLRGWLHGISSNRVAQLMIVGWSFQFLIEGASGFGTPAALAAPVLVGLGFPALRVAMVCLVMNSIPVAFGAVGTPTWFGFGPLGLEPEVLRNTAIKTALLLIGAAWVVPVLALRLVVGWRELRGNALFIALSIAAAVLPMAAAATVNDEFPTVIGGLVGLGVTILLARAGIGLAGDGAKRTPAPLITGKVLYALTPLLVTVGILLVTRIPALGLRQWLTATSPAAEWSLGGLGVFSVSTSLVLSLRGILGEVMEWSHATLYVPSIVPFFLSATLALMLFRRLGVAGEVIRETSGRLVKPVLALLGALAFVKVLMVGGESASTLILGNALAETTGGNWKFFAPLLGALGSFFSGSATISNLTFGGIQTSIALETGVEVSTLLALQSAGAAVGNMVCVHNIVAVCAVLGLQNQEGAILRRTAVPLLAAAAVYALLAIWL